MTIKMKLYYKLFHLQDDIQQCFSSFDFGEYLFSLFHFLVTLLEILFNANLPCGSEALGLDQLLRHNQDSYSFCLTFIWALSSWFSW